ERNRGQGAPDGVRCRHHRCLGVERADSVRLAFSLFGPLVLHRGGGGGLPGLEELVQVEVGRAGERFIKGFGFGLTFASDCSTNRALFGGLFHVNKEVVDETYDWTTSRGVRPRLNSYSFTFPILPHVLLAPPHWHTVSSVAPFFSASVSNRD